MTVKGILKKYLREQLGNASIVETGGDNDFLERGLREIHLDELRQNQILPGHQCAVAPLLRQQFFLFKIFSAGFILPEEFLLITSLVTGTVHDQLTNCAL